MSKRKFRTKKNAKLVVRFLVGAVFFISGLNFSNTLFFEQNPLFGINFLAEIIISIAAALFGFYLVPTYSNRAKKWIEDLVVDTTKKLVSDFWNQYTERLETTRKQRQKDKKKNDKKKLQERLNGGVLIDTSVLIDGRIVQIAKTGFLKEPLILPRFVINELHLLADNTDEVKRKKGRRGLDQINKLKKHAKVVVHGKKATSEGADKELIALAKAAKLKIMTLDFNLNKVAKVSSIKVLNINSLVEAIKPMFVPGDAVTVKIVQKGKGKGQGLGYLDDGTMLVVAGAEEKVGQEVAATVSKLLQSNAGKMVFCELAK